MNHEIEWYKAHSKYQDAVKTQRYKDAMALNHKEIRELKNTIDQFSSFMVSDIKEYLQRMFADKLNSHIYRRIMRAIQKSGLKDNNIITLKFSASNLRFLSPQEIQAMVLDRFMMHVKSNAKFDLTTRFNSDNGMMQMYTIIIPELIYRYNKLI